jgi:flagellar basal-body rod modification protein FlgD
MDTSTIQNSLGLGNTSSSESLSSTVSGQASLGKEDFLKLLVAQLANQDPLQPMENTQFVAQLAQFSNLEQLVSVNSNLELLQIGQASSTNSEVASLIGREIEANGNQLQLTQQGPANLNFSLSAAAKEVNIQVRNAKGDVIRTLTLGSRSSGVNSVVWDGRDSSGNLMPTGTYQIEVSAKDAKGDAVTSSTRIKGTVSGITYQNGVPLLEIGSTTVRVADVVAVRLPGGTTTSSNGSP